MAHLSYMKYLPHYKGGTIRVGTDCSGIEAPLQALKALNIPYNHVFASEIDKTARGLLIKNYGKPKYFSDDITKRQHSRLPEVDLYIAGFPCQAFSHLGNRGGFDDLKGRGLIFFECYETIICTKPSMFILENVKGLLTHDKGYTIKLIIDSLKKLDYDIYIDLLNTKNYGLPQNRERVYIVGLRKGQYGSFSYPEPIPLEISVSDIVAESTYTPPTPLTPHKKQILDDLLRYDIIDTLNKPWVVNLNCSSYKRSSPMLDISPCLMASGAIYYVTSAKRNLTPDEFLKLQGFLRFDVDGEYAKIYSVAGNSMSVPVIAFIIVNIFNVKLR